MYSLLRGGVLLGRYAECSPVTHHGKRVGAAGVLEPAHPMRGEASVMQVRWSVLPGEPVFQHQLASEWIGARREPPRAVRQAPQTSVLKPLSADEARGVPAERILEIRADDDSIIPADSVTLQLWELPEGADVAEVLRGWGISGSPDEIWMVSFSDHGTSGNSPTK